MKTIIGIFLWAACAVFGQNDRGRASSDSLYSLTLTIKDSAITCTEAHIVAKSARKSWFIKEGELQFAVQSTAGAELLSGAMKDPRIIHYDYVDPVHEGVLVGGMRVSPRATFTLRIPYSKDFHKIVFFAKSTLPKGVLTKSAIGRRELGSFNFSSVVQ